MTLINVLCVPSFDFNLLSISQLTQDLSCYVVFLSGLCYIQDLCSWRTIGLAEQQGSFYHLKSGYCNLNVAHHISSNSVPKSCNISSNNLWHYRLGHMSFTMLKILQTDNSAIFFSDSSPSEICPLAKQRKLSFPSSQHISQHIFDLVHCDVRGPMAISTTNSSKYFLTIVDDFSR